MSEKKRRNSGRENGFGYGPTRGPFDGERHSTAKENLSILACVVAAFLLMILFDALS